jgi:uncharacterized glyoxalase superfamily protein PhnB
MLYFKNGEDPMKPFSLSPTFTTDRVVETRDFYVKYFKAKVIFDCGWYVNLQFGNEYSTIQFMSLKEPEHQLSNSAGLVYNFRVKDVDREFKELTRAGLELTLPLEDHPWGDRGFAVKDPNGIMLYVYSEREPSDEFKQYYK